jgi:excisionase family DNA binding protein
MPDWFPDFVRELVALSPAESRELDAMLAENEARAEAAKSPRRQYKPRPAPPDGLRTAVERVSIDKAAAILGLSVRTVQALAARGEIAGAAKIGRRWTFDPEKLRRLVKQREQETWQSGKRQPDVTGGETPSGRGLRFVGAKSDGRFTQVTRRLRGRATKPGASD